MASAKRRRLTAEQRREVIERAATEVFAEHGYHGASMAEIARRAGVTPPILYDHFASKRDLHRRLLERHFAQLRAIWREHLGAEAPAAQRIPAAFDAWFAYIEAHPFVARMLFRDTTGDPEIEQVRRDVAARSREQARPLLAREPGAEAVAGSGDALAMDLAWEVVRAVLQGLALWWADHPEVPRAQIVATAMNALWIGFERASQGETWRPEPPAPGAATPTGG